MLPENCRDDPSAIHVAIVADESLFRDLLVATLSREDGLKVCGVFSDAESALDGILSSEVQVVVIDLELDGPMGGVELGLKLRERMPDLGILVLARSRDPVVLDPDTAHATSTWSYVSEHSISSVRSLKRAIEDTAEGFVVRDRRSALVHRSGEADEDGRLSSLRPRHREILALIAQGLSNGAIAKRLHLSNKSVENQVNLLYDELQISRHDREYQPRVKAALLYLEWIRRSKPRA